jgi:hypothetical protein
MIGEPSLFANTKSVLTPCLAAFAGQCNKSESDKATFCEAAWIPKNFNEAVKRNAGRRKLHRRRRKARADRIVSLLSAMAASSASELLETSRGWVGTLSFAMQVSSKFSYRVLKDGCDC